MAAAAGPAPATDGLPITLHGPRLTPDPQR
jgi:hypothetical protein